MNYVHTSLELGTNRALRHPALVSTNSTFRRLARMETHRASHSVGRFAPSFGASRMVSILPGTRPTRTRNQPSPHTTTSCAVYIYVDVYGLRSTDLGGPEFSRPAKYDTAIMHFRTCKSKMLQLSSCKEVRCCDD